MTPVTSTVETGIARWLRYWRLPLVVLMLVAYALPWVVGPGAALTFGAYDLAEWASLHPVVRAESPPLLTSLLLRLPLACIAVIVAFSFAPGSRRARWLSGLFAILIAVALLPPLEFFLSAGNDPNYRQQFMLACAVLLASILSFVVDAANAKRLLAALFCLVASVASGLGLAQAYGLMAGFGVRVTFGPGAPLLIVSLLLFAAQAVFLTQKKSSLPS